MVRLIRKRRLLFLFVFVLISIQFALPLLSVSKTFAAPGDIPVEAESPDGNYRFEVDGETVRILGPNGSVFVRYQNAFTQEDSSFDGCVDKISVPSGAPSGDSITLIREVIYSTGCSKSIDASITVTNALAAADADFGSNNLAGTEDNSTATGEPTCESESGSLGWIACPGVTLMLGAVESIADIIGTLLTIRPIQAEDGNAVFEIWKSLRTLSLAILVIAALVAVFGQALFINMDAYTFKKMVPRLAIGAIGIALSFYICMVLIDFFNVFGRGMFDLIEKSAGALNFGTNTSSGIAALIIGAMAGGGAYLLIAGPATIATIIGVLLPVVLAFITALAIIMLRHVLVIVLVAISPLAIACWILPNTENYFKRWWGLFSTILMMYPLIMIMLAAGNVVAVMLVNDGGEITDSNFINFLLALLALGATMAAIPFTIRASGGLLTKLTGTLNNPNRGPIDGLRKRIEGSKESAGKRRIEDMAHANRTGKNWAGKSVGKGTGAIGRARHGWYSYKTGTGWGQGGKYKEENRLAVEGQAMTGSDRQEVLREQAEKKAKELAKFKIDLEVRNLDIRDAQNRLEAIALGTATNKNGELINFNNQEVVAAVQKLGLFRGEEQLGRIFGQIGANNPDFARQIQKESFEDIDGWAPHLSRGAIQAPPAGQAGPSRFKANYDSLFEMNSDDFARKIPKATIKSAARSSDQNAVRVVEMLANARPEARNKAVVTYLKGSDPTDNLALDVSSHGAVIAQPSTVHGGRTIGDEINHM